MDLKTVTVSSTLLLMKTCIRCSQEKEVADFNFKFKSKGIRQTQCKSCTRTYIREHYYKNREYYLTKARRNNLIIRQEVKKYIWEYLSTHSCIDCGEKDIIVLEFDHKQDDKFREIGKMVSGRYSLEKVKIEVQKCEIRCADCHRRKTAKQLGWHKKIMPL